MNHFLNALRIIAFRESRLTYSEVQGVLIWPLKLSYWLLFEIFQIWSLVLHVIMTKNYSFLSASWVTSRRCLSEPVVEVRFLSAGILLLLQNLKGKIFRFRKVIEFGSQLGPKWPRSVSVTLTWPCDLFMASNNDRGSVGKRSRGSRSLGGMGKDETREEAKNRRGKTPPENHER